MSFSRFLGWSVVTVLVTCASAQTSDPKSSEVDFPALVHETQQQIGEAGYTGLVWWIPPKYWQLSAERMGFSADKAAERYKSLNQYTMLVVAVGKIGIGTINWYSDPEIRKNIRLRDANGDTYSPVEKVSGDAQGLASILQPVFANNLGPMGQNCDILFFPGADKMAQTIADPLAEGSFSVTINNLIAAKDETFEWRLPLTSLSPAKYCPIGRERVQANWKYCPWHGIKLDTNGKVGSVPEKK